MLDESGLFYGMLPVVPAAAITSLDVPSINITDNKGVKQLNWSPVSGATYLEVEIRRKT
jgi:hypothetical protein